MARRTEPTTYLCSEHDTVLASSLVRNMALGQFLETFLVAAVTAILVIRVFLAATGYPRLGGGGLYIAHLLWGGLLMLLALVLLLAFLGKRFQAHLVKNHQLPKSIADASWGLFLSWVCNSG